MDQGAARSTISAATTRMKATCGTQQVENMLRYAGMPYDASTGLYQLPNGAGFYDPTTGQTPGCHDQGPVDPGEDRCGPDEPGEWEYGMAGSSLGGGAYPAVNATLQSHISLSGILGGISGVVRWASGLVQHRVASFVQRLSASLAATYARLGVTRSALTSALKTCIKGARTTAGAGARYGAIVGGIGGAYTGAVAFVPLGPGGMVLGAVSAGALGAGGGFLTGAAGGALQGCLDYALFKDQGQNVGT